MTTHAREISLAELSKDSVNHEMANRQPDVSQNELMATAEYPQKLHDILQNLAIALSKPLDELLVSLATLTRQVALVELCVVMLLDTADSQLITMTSSPDLLERGVKVIPLEVDQPLLAKLCDIKAPGQFPPLNIHEQAQLNPLKNIQYETLVIIPLIAQDTCIGLINCYSSKCIELPVEVRLLISTIAMQASLAIRYHLLLNTPTQAYSTRAFFDDLLTGKTDVEDQLRARATSLGCNATTPHVLVMLATLHMLESHEEVVVISEESQVNAFRRTLKLAKYRILEHYPGSLLDERENILYCIVPLDGDYTDGGLGSWLDDLMLQVEQEQRIHMFAGLSSICNDIGDYRRGFAEAEEALQIGQLLNHEGRSAYFNDLGIYRYLYTFACSDNLHDLYLDQVATIARYDRGRKRSELLNTLELYLEHDGNIKDTSELLAVHRNTVAQRILRIQSLCSSNVQLPGHRLALLAAIKIHRLRASRL